MIRTDSKNSFILYNDYEKYFKQLTDTETASVLFAVFAYSKNGDEPESLTPMAAMVFSFIRDQLDRDMEKYRQICEKNRKNSLKRFEKKSSADNGGYRPTSTDIHNDNDNVNETDTDTDNVTDTDNERSPQGGGGEITEADFEEFWREYPKHNGTEEAKQVFFEAVYTREDLARLTELVGKWKRSSKWREEGGRWIKRADKFLTDIFPAGELPPNFEEEDHWEEFFQAALRRRDRIMSETPG
ncbi:MAG: hypothetical protein IJ386_00350 [Clostridia bacterium]|nr:hypothetical protein [Clostridia bacterium]